MECEDTTDVVNSVEVRRKADAVFESISAVVISNDKTQLTARDSLRDIPARFTTALGSNGWVSVQGCVLQLLEKGGEQSVGDLAP